MFNRATQRRNALFEYARFSWKSSVPKIVFYAEDGGSWPHFEGLVGELVKRGHSVVYLTSSKCDPILSAARERIDAYWIGDGFIRNVLFQSLKNALVIMTMPDLQTFHIRRSLFSTTHYLYLFHSIVSSHMIYREAAFDHFDTIMCAGPHHIDEIRQRERIYGLKPKRLFEYGYGNLDTLIKEADCARLAGDGHRPDTPIRVLVAPSWGPQGILETLGEEVSTRLLEAGYLVTVRPHPRTVLLTPAVIDRLRDRFQSHERFRLELQVHLHESLLNSDVMISDYSGVAFEYAFGLEKPVLFIDVPKKINNLDWESLGMPPIEVALRREMGYLIQPQAISDLPTLIAQLFRDQDQWPQRLRTLRERIVCNVAGSATIGADIVESLFDELFS